MPEPQYDNRSLPGGEDCQRALEGDPVHDLVRATRQRRWFREYVVRQFAFPLNRAVVVQEFPQQDGPGVCAEPLAVAEGVPAPVQDDQGALHQVVRLEPVAA